MSKILNAFKIPSESAPWLCPCRNFAPIHSILSSLAHGWPSRHNNIGSTHDWLNFCHDVRSINFNVEKTSDIIIGWLRWCWNDIEIGYVPMICNTKWQHWMSMFLLLSYYSSAILSNPANILTLLQRQVWWKKTLFQRCFYVVVPAGRCAPVVISSMLWAPSPLPPCMLKTSISMQQNTKMNQIWTKLWPVHPQINPSNLLISHSHPLISPGCPANQHRLQMPPKIIMKEWDILRLDSSTAAQVLCDWGLTWYRCI